MLWARTNRKRKVEKILWPDKLTKSLTFAYICLPPSALFNIVFSLMWLELLHNLVYGLPMIKQSSHLLHHAPHSII